MSDTTLGGRLRSIRKERGLTLKDVGLACNCDKTNVSHVEGNRVRPNVDLLRSMAVLYRCSIDELVALDAALPAVAVAVAADEPALPVVEQRPTRPMSQREIVAAVENGDIEEDVERFDLDEASSGGEAA